MKKFLIPIAIYICFAALYIGYSRIENSRYLYLPVWDVRHYLDISEIGYQVYPCTPGVEYPAGEICGNPGWYPFWPLVVKAVRPLLGGSSQTTFIGLVFLFTLLSFLMLFYLMEKRFGSVKAAVATAALAFGPGSFYLLTGFPYALFIFLLLLYLFFLYRIQSRGRSIGLFMAALGLSLTYPSGILAAIIPLGWYLFDGGGDKSKRKTLAYWLKLAGYMIPFVLGPLLLWSYFYIKFDDFFLQLHFQAKYQRTWAIPFAVIIRSLFHYPLLSPENGVILWYGFLLIFFLPYRTGAGLWLLALVLYLFSPATGTTMSIYRHYLINVPAYMILGSSERPLWLKAVFIAAGLFLAVKILFPLFISNLLI